MDLFDILQPHYETNRLLLPTKFIVSANGNFPKIYLALCISILYERGNKYLVDVLPNVNNSTAEISTASDKFYCPIQEIILFIFRAHQMKKK